MKHNNTIRLLVFSALGAVVFFGLDSIHVATGIWHAADGEGVPPHYAFVYFVGIFAVGLGLRRLERRWSLAVSPRALAIDLAAFGLLLVAHLLWFRDEMLLAGFCAAFLVVRWAWFRQPGDVVVAAVVMLADFAVELPGASAGLYAYGVTDYGVLPLWLCPFWAGLGLSLRRFYRAVTVGFPQPVTSAQVAGQQRHMVGSPAGH